MRKALHVRRPRVDATTTWCGRPIAVFDWLFTGLDHAIASMESGSLQSCKHCMRAAVKALTRAAL